jgi:hypothetical protein
LWQFSVKLIWQIYVHRLSIWQDKWESCSWVRYPGYTGPTIHWCKNLRLENWSLSQFSVWLASRQHETKAIEKKESIHSQRSLRVISAQRQSVYLLSPRCNAYIVQDCSLKRSGTGRWEEVREMRICTTRTFLQFCLRYNFISTVMLLSAASTKGCVTCGWRWRNSGTDKRIWSKNAFEICILPGFYSEWPFLLSSQFILGFILIIPGP